MSLLESLNWRAAIKKFDPSQKVSQDDLDKLLEAGNLTATSGGLQPFKIAVVSNEQTRSKLVPASYGQQQVADASHVLVFAVETDVDEGIIDAFAKRIQKVRNYVPEYLGSMKNYIAAMDSDARQAWAKNQAYIALGTVLTAAADLRIDTCPMEGFNALEYQELLGLKEKNLMPVLVLPIGYRAAGDAYSKEAKVRKTREEFVLELV